MQKIYIGDKAGNVVATVRHERSMCWCPVTAVCAIPSMLAVSVCDGWNWCTNTPFVETEETLYDGAWTQDSSNLTAKEVGKVKTLEQIQCVTCPVCCWCCCCPCMAPIAFSYRQMIKYSVQIKTGAEEDAAATAAAALIPMVWAGGIPTPCQCCILPPVPKPVGCPCGDAGRSVDVTRGTVQEALKEYQREFMPDGIAPGAAGARLEVVQGEIEDAPAKA